MRRAGRIVEVAHGIGLQRKMSILVQTPDQHCRHPVRTDMFDTGRYVTDTDANTPFLRSVRCGAMNAQSIVKREVSWSEGCHYGTVYIQILHNRLLTAVDAILDRIV